MFFVGFVVARIAFQGDLESHANAPEPLTEPMAQVYEPANEPKPPTEDTAQLHESDEMWFDFFDITFSDMRQSIMEYGAIAFEDATGIDIVFNNPNEIISIVEPHVMARGLSSSRQSFVYVIFTYQHWRNGWRVDGYNIWGQWNMQPQLTRGIREGRRYVDENAVGVRFYERVDWGGGQSSPPIHASIPGEIFAEEFISLMRQYVGINILDMWFIGEGRLYVNLDSVIMDQQGSAAGYANLVSLYKALFSIPGVEEIVVLVEGQSEQASDHMGFGHISRRDDTYIQSMLELPR